MSYQVSNSNDSGDGSFNKAIEDANNNTATDSTITITIDTVTLPGSLISLNNSSRKITINGDSGSSKVTVQRTGGSADPRFRIFTVAVGSTVVMNNLIITGGYTADSVFGDGGGGILNEGDLTLNDCVVSGNYTGNGDDGNRGGYGGGIYSSGGTLTLNSSEVSDNRTGDGDSSINGGNGGGIYSRDGTLTLNSSTISDNYTGDGGYGGGIFIANNASIIINSSILDNGKDSNDNIKTSQGGGFLQSGGPNSETIMTNVTIDGNETTNEGGGFYITGGILTSINCTITDNISASSIGNNLFINDSFATVQIGNTILDTTTGSNSVSGTVDTSTLGGNYTGDSPDLGDLALNGGTTKCRKPNPTSPVIKIGNPALVNDTYFPDPPTDQRGQPRTDGGDPAKLDAGSVETDYPPLNHTVTDGGDGNPTIPQKTLRQIINEIMANPSPNGDVIDFDVPTVTLTQGELNISASAPLNLRIDGGSGVIIQRDQNLDPPNNFRIFNINTINYSYDIVFDFLTIRYGSTLEEPGNPGSGHGGGIFAEGFEENESLNFTLNNCKISDNNASVTAGGISYFFNNTNQLGNLALNDCEITDNNGAGIDHNVWSMAAGGDFTINNCIIRNNIGGGIFLSTNNDNLSVNMSKCMVENNSLGGGLGIRGSSDIPKINISECTFDNNNTTGGGFGGAIDCANASTTLTNCTIKNNEIINGRGGGISHGYSLALINCTISNNLCNEQGSGIYSSVDNVGASFTAINCTIDGNRVAEPNNGSAIYINNGDINNTRIINCTITENMGFGIYNNPGFNASSTVGNTIISMNTQQNQIYGTYEDPQLGSNYINIASPGLTNLRYNGGITLTRKPNPGAIAIINKGNNAIVNEYFSQAGLPTPYTDQRGYTRIYDGTVDVGSVEYIPPTNHIVTNPGDENPFEIQTLRQVIASIIANPSPNGDAIQFDVSTVTLTQGELNIPASASLNLTIDGGSGVIIQRDQNLDPPNNFRIFNISGTNTIVYFESVTITGGLDSNGGGISNIGSTLYLSDSIISGNTSQSDGGGIRSNGGITNLTNCTISGNAASDGGGIHNTNSIVNLAGCTISGNSANANGGGIFSSSFFGPPQLNFVNCTVCSNTTGNDLSGSIHIGGSGSVSTIINCTITGTSGNGETPDEYGIYIDSGATPENQEIGNTVITEFNNTDQINFTLGASSTNNCVQQTNPGLGVLSDNGGTTLTREPVQPAPLIIDQGDIGFVVDNFPKAYPGVPEENFPDQRGYYRFGNSPNLTVDIGSVEHNSSPICFSGESIILTKIIMTDEITYTKAKQTLPTTHLVYSTTKNEFIPFKLNAITGPTERYMLIKQNLLGEGIPTEDFKVTSGHCVQIDGVKMKSSKIEGAVRISVEPELVYTIVTEEEEIINVNNLPVYTMGYQYWLDYTRRKMISWSANKSK